MMIDNTEDNEFRELLADYAAQIADDGFSAMVMDNVPEGVMTQVPAAKPTQAPRLKYTLIGGASILAALVAAPQVQKLHHMISSVQVPDVSLSANFWQNFNAPTVAMFAILSMTIAWLGGAFLFGADV